jgi:N utilization substance protein A
MENQKSIELIKQIKLIADERRISQDSIAEAFKESFMVAYQKEFNETNIEIVVDIDNYVFQINRLLKVVEPYDDLNEYEEIAIQNAKGLQLNETFRQSIDISSLSRTFVMHALQMFKHKITVKSNQQIFKE